MKVKVIREFYRVADKDFDGLKDAVTFAYREVVERNYYSLTIQRVVQYEPTEPDAFFEALGMPYEAVTGEYTLPGPPTIMFKSDLSRYHPVNGWEVPEYIEVD